MSRSRQRFALLGAFLSFSLLAAACGDDDDTDGTTDTTEDTTDDTTEDTTETGGNVDGKFSFGALLPQTGDLSAYGPGMLAGVELAIEDINAGGGVFGADVELLSADTATDPVQANTQTEQMINNDKVDGILGPAGSSEVLLGSIEPVIGAGIVECTGSSTSPVFSAYEDEGLFFRTAPSDKFQSQLLATTIAGDGFTNVAIIYRSDDYGQAFAELTAAELEANGITVAEEVGYNADNPDFDADASSLAAIDGIEAIVVIAFPEDATNLLKAMIEQGVGPADVQHYYTDGLATDTLANSVDSTDLGQFDSVKGTRPGAASEPTEFNARLAAEKGVTETTFAANFYDCAVMLALGAVVADSEVGAEIAAVMVEVTSGGEKCTTFADCIALHEAGTDFDFDGVTGFDLNETGEPAQGVYELWKFDGGAIEVLATETMTS